MTNASKAAQSQSSRPDLFMLGIADLLRGIDNGWVSHLVGAGDIRRHYVRSRIDPFCLTISTGTMVAALGLLWSTLWTTAVADRLPFVAVSLTVWTAINGTLAEAEHYLLSLNPFAVLLAVVRERLPSQPLTAGDRAAGAAFSLAGFWIALPIVGCCQRRIIYRI
jgi:ABC-type polysaccharide/polyol phosphate export permease